MSFLDRTLRYEGYERRRVLLARDQLAGYVPPQDWEIEAYGQPFETPGRGVAVTLRKPLPPVARKETILNLALALLKPHGKCSLSWMSGKFGLTEYETVRMLEAAGIPPKGSERPWLRQGDRLFWFQGDDLRSKLVEREEAPPEEQDFFGKDPDNP